MRTLRSILNSGYRRGARITRKKGREWESIYVFGPVAFAGMGSLPDTIMDRSIPIRMQRRQPHQKIETYMPRTHEAIGKAIGESVGQWIRSVMFELTNSWPEMPEGIADRKSEVAESLLAVADAAGGHWPKDARTAIKELLLETKANAGPSPAERVMRDLRVIWPDGKPRVSTTDLLIALFNLDGAPWSTIWDPMSASRELAALLATKGIAPRKVKLGAVALQGYRKEDFGITWSAIDASDRAKAEAEAKAEADRLARRETRGADDTSALDELEDDE